MKRQGRGRRKIERRGRKARVTEDWRRKKDEGKTGRGRREKRKDKGNKRRSGRGHPRKHVESVRLRGARRLPRHFLSLPHVAWSCPGWRRKRRTKTTLKTPSSHAPLNTLQVVTVCET